MLFLRKGQNLAILSCISELQTHISHYLHVGTSATVHLLSVFLSRIPYRILPPCKTLCMVESDPQTTYKTKKVLNDYHHYMQQYIQIFILELDEQDKKRHHLLKLYKCLRSINTLCTCYSQS